MNPKLQPLFARRSIRQYHHEPVSDDQIRDLLEAAMAAPSAVAKDPWHFIVVRDQEARDRLADGLPHGQYLREAAAGIVICGDLERAYEHQESYLLQDCSAAIQNLLLAASMLGLGGVWIGVHPHSGKMDHVRGLYDLPPHVIPIAAVSLGRPAESPEPRTRYRDEAVHQESFEIRRS